MPHGPSPTSASLARAAARGYPLPRPRQQPRAGGPHGRRGAHRFVPGTLPLTLKIFGISVLAAALSWSLGVLALFIGGQRVDLRRARAAVVLSGTPWYALTLYLAWLM